MTVSVHDQSYPSLRAAWWTVAVVFAAYIVSFVDRTILTLLVAPIRADLGLSDVEIGLVGGLAFGLFYAALGLPLGWLADRVSRRGLIATGIVIWSAATAACGLAQSFAGLFAARMLVGVGEAALAPAALSLIAASFTPARRSLPIAVFVAAGSVGGGLALIFGGRLVGALSGGVGGSWPLVGALAPWRASFVLVGLAGVPIAVAALLTKEPGRTRDDAPSIAGAATTRPAWPVLRPLIAAMALLSVVAYGQLAWIPTHFIRDFGWTATQVGGAFGLVFLIAGSTGATIGGACARGAARDDRPIVLIRIALYGLCALVVPAIAAPLMPSAPSTLAMLAPTMFLFAWPSGVAVAAVQALTPATMRGRITATYYLVINLVGLSLGAPLVALLADNLGGLGIGMAIVAALALPLAAWSAFHALSRLNATA